jgi:hypothetical protein
MGMTVGMGIWLFDQLTCRSFSLIFGRQFCLYLDDLDERIGDHRSARLLNEE